jgi:hypothetical protein
MVLTLERYSEKSIAVFGDTELYKEKLLELGGKYNAHLKGRAGWIFRLNMQAVLEAFIVSPSSERVETRVQNTHTTHPDLSAELLEIQNMISILQRKFNLVMDIVEKQKSHVQVESEGDDEEKPKSLLRR